ncbi:MAG: STAS domain-containing protein [Devosia sp.]|jgi:anti-anti-sigma regulatory factor|nr:STAS domain-containing protein [Devosiaceae bacterium]
MASKAGNQVGLPAVVDLDALDGVRDALSAAMDKGPVELSADGVERISTNALLMLLSAAETAGRNNSSLIITGASATMRAAIERLGFAPSFSGLLKG